MRPHLPSIRILLFATLAWGASACSRPGLSYEEAREITMAMLKAEQARPAYIHDVQAHYGTIPLYVKEYIQIDSRATGISGMPGRYYQKVLMLADVADVSVFRQMTTDPDPRVRVTGLICLAIREKKVPILRGDYAEIATIEGCFGQVYTLEEFSIGLQPDGELRGHYAN